jgi:hypothetical protein
VSDYNSLQLQVELNEDNIKNTDVIFKQIIYSNEMCKQHQIQKVSKIYFIIKLNNTINL